VSMIQQCEDEFRRQEATQFERIFPDEELGETFAPLFESQRQSNKILHSWVQCRKNPPQRLLDLLDMKPSAVPGARADQTKGGSYRPRSPRSKVVPNPPKLKRSMSSGP
jgi:hypothetical protein